MGMREKEQKVQIIYIHRKYVLYKTAKLEAIKMTEMRFCFTS